MIDKYDPDLASDLREFAKEKQAFLVVPIYTDYPDFSNCIAYSLKKDNMFYNLRIGMSPIWINTHLSTIDSIATSFKIFD